MNRVLRFSLELLSLSFLPGATAFAEEVAMTGNQFSLISQGARESAMGGNFSALSDEGFGVFGNPAATSTSKGGDLSFSQLFWFTDTNYETLAFDQTLDNVGTLGVGLSLYWIPAFDNTGGAESAFSSTSYQAVFSYGTPLKGWGFDGFSLGASARFIADTFGTLAQTGDLALDLGAYYQTDWKPLKFGFTFKNLDLSPSKLNTIPFSYSFGFALEQGPWLLAGELLETDGQDLQFQLGGEYWIQKFLALRAGFRSQDTNGSFFEPSLGVGLKVGSDARFDYAAASYGDLGLVHWIALDLSWGPSVPKPTPTPIPVAAPVTIIREAPPAPQPTPKIIYIVKTIKVATPKTIAPAVTAYAPPTELPKAIPVTPSSFPLRGVVDNSGTVWLSWPAQSTNSGPTIGYNVYVSMVQGASFRKITDKPITATQWSEQAGLHGITFYYQVKALDSAGIETSASEIRNINVP